MKVNPNLPWAVELRKEGKWVIHSSYKSRGSAEVTLNFLRKHARNIEFQMSFNSNNTPQNKNV